MTATQIQTYVPALVPTLITRRLKLRAPQVSDFADYAATLASARSVHIGGGFDRRQAWLDFCQDIASWHLHGFGAWTVTLSADGTVAGSVMLHHEIGDPERELGWILHDGFEGNGYATEAATIARDHALGALGWDTCVSYIDPSNTPSIRVADRLGAVVDTAADKPDGYPDCLVYRHRLADKAAGSAQESAPESGPESTGASQ